MSDELAVGPLEGWELDAITTGVEGAVGSCAMAREELASAHEAILSLRRDVERMAQELRARRAGQVPFSEDQNRQAAAILEGVLHDLHRHCSDVLSLKVEDRVQFLRCLEGFFRDLHKHLKP